MTGNAVDPWTQSIPKGFENIEGAAGYFTYQARWNNAMWVRTGAGEDTLSDTVATVLTQGEKLDLMTITQAVDLDALETTVSTIATGSPAFTPSNASTDRSWNCNAAVPGTGIDVADAGPADVALLSDHDALVGVVQELSDVVATLVADLATKGITG